MKNKLSETQFEILKHLVEGKSNPQIALEMHLSIHTIKTHLSAILRKMDASSRVEIVTKAFRSHLVS